MKISLSWLQDFVELIEKDPQKIADVLTERAAEVDSVTDLAEDFNCVVVGQIREISPHPDADKVRITKTEVGNGEVLQIICGAKNIEVGQKVPVAMVGAVLPGGFAIDKRKMRGVESCGMLCSGKELGLTDDAEGILILDESPLDKGGMGDLQLGTPIAEVFGVDDAIFEVDNTAITNRPDLFSHYGFARELVACGLAKWKQKDFDFSSLEDAIPEPVLDSDRGTDFPVKFTIESNELCPARGEAVMENVSVQPSPKWMQQRLEACGIRAINNLVDISNYVMLETGMPLHIFDLDQISGESITMREAKKGEEVVTLDGEKRVVPEGTIIQEDNQKIFDLAGIMGGENSEVTEQTNRILVHVPVYDPLRIRKAALALAHRTDAATIYEKRVPNSSVFPGLMRTLELLKEFCPDAVISSNVEIVEHIPDEEKEIALPLKMVTRVLGQEISEQDIIRILEDLDFEVDISGETLTVQVPGHRLRDITIPEDIVEEIVRIYGINDIAPAAPEMKMHSVAISPLRRIKREISDFLTSHGAYEFLNLAFLGPDLLQKCGQTPDESYIEVANPLSIDQSLLRQSLLPKLLEKSEENRRHFDAFRVFETGKVFHISPPDKLVLDSDRGGDTGGSQKTETVMNSTLFVGEDFSTAKGILESLFETLHVPVRIDEPKNGASLSSFAARGALILSGKDVVGEVIELKKSLRKNFDLPDAVSAFSLNLSKLSESVRRHKKILPLPKFPGIELDLSVLADTDVSVKKVVNSVKNIDPLLVSADILEIFEGKGVPEGKKSVTVHFEFRSAERTLEGEEVEKLKEKILEKLEKDGFPFRF